MIIIDAYNCLHAASAMSGLISGLSLRELCVLVSGSRQKVVLVMDGLPKPDEPKADEFINIELRYSGKNLKADDLIAQILQKSTGRRESIVVSNDRQVAAQARRAGAKSISCERFLSLRTQAKKNSLKSPGMPGKTQGAGAINETDFWLKEFGIAGPSGNKSSNKKPEQINPEEIDMEDYL